MSDPDPERTRPSLAIWASVATVAILIGSQIGMPGIDHDALAELDGGAGLLGAFNIAPVTAPVLGTGVGTMVLVFLVLIVTGALDKPIARRIGLSIWIIASAIQGYALAVYTVCWRSRSTARS